MSRPFLPRGTLHLLRQTQWRGSLVAEVNALGEGADLVGKLLESKAGVDGGSGEHHSSSASGPSENRELRIGTNWTASSFIHPQARWSSSNVGSSDRSGRGQGSGVFHTPGAFTLNGDNEGGVPLEGGAEGQFEDAESDKKTSAPTNILQEILAASAKESEKRMGGKSGAREGGAEPSGQNQSSARVITPRSFNNNTNDLMRIFQPKSSVFSADPPDESEGLFRPRRSSEPPPEPASQTPLSEPGLYRDEMDSIAHAEPPFGYGERTAMPKETRVIYRGTAGDTGGGVKKRVAPSLSEIFAKSKPAEDEVKTDPVGGRMTYKRDASRGRGRQSASDFRQRVLGLPPEEPQPSVTERSPPGAGRGSRQVMGGRGGIGRRQEDEDDRPPQYGIYAINSTIPDDKPRREGKAGRSAEEREAYEKRESEKEEKELDEAAKETAEDIEDSEWWERMRVGFEAQPDELGVPHVPELEVRDHLAVALEPEYAMEAFGTLPDLNDSQNPTLEDALAACKEELMQLSGIEDEETWQAMLKRTLSRTSELEALVKQYNPNKNRQVTATQQHQILGDIYREMPEQGSPFRSPEMVAHVSRALQTLEHNCRWPLDRKKAVMSSLVAQLGKYDGSTKGSKLMHSVFG